MNKIRNITLILLLVAAVIGAVCFHNSALAPIQAPTSGQIIPGQYIVVLKNANGLASLAKMYNAKLSYRSALTGFAAKLSDAQVEELKRNPQVKYIENDMVINLLPGETFSGIGYANKLADKQQLPTGVDRVDADENPVAKIDGKDERVDIDVAVIDTGSGPHKDVYIHRSFTYVEGTKTGDDDHGHGTHCACIIAALDNEYGVVGGAPGARIWSFKGLNSKGQGTAASIIGCVDGVTQNANEIELCSMSLGGEFNNKAFNDAISRSVAAGVTYVVAAGNSAKDAKTFSPASHPDVICVSAIADFDGKPGAKGVSTCRDDEDDSFANFSNFGQVVEIASPGVCILSGWLNNDYKVASGTSMATPLEAADVAIYIVQHPGLKPAQVREAVIAKAKAQNSAHGFTGDPDEYHEPMGYIGK